MSPITSISPCLEGRYGTRPVESRTAALAQWLDTRLQVENLGLKPQMR